MNMDNKENELQAKIDNVATVLRSYASENLRIYKKAIEELGEDSRLAIAKKAALDEITNIMEELGVEWHLKRFYFTFGSADYYTQEQWDSEVKKYFENVKPAEIIE